MYRVITPLPLPPIPPHFSGSVYNTTYCIFPFSSTLTISSAFAFVYSIYYFDVHDDELLSRNHFISPTAAQLFDITACNATCACKGTHMPEIANNTSASVYTCLRRRCHRVACLCSTVRIPVCSWIHLSARACTSRQTKRQQTPFLCHNTSPFIHSFVLVSLSKNG